MNQVGGRDKIVNQHKQKQSNKPAKDWTALSFKQKTILKVTMISHDNATEWQNFILHMMYTEEQKVHRLN